MLLATNETDIEIFNSIIDMEICKNIKYDWATLFEQFTMPNKYTVLHYCDEFISQKVYAAVLELMKKEKVLNNVINAQDIAGRTPLIEAALHANYKLMALLIYYGADISLKCKAGQTALDYVINLRSQPWDAFNYDDAVQHSNLKKCLELLKKASSSQDQLNHAKINYCSCM